MVVTFDVNSEKADVFRVILSSGKDAFFAADNVVPLSDIEIVEIDLERVSGEHPATMKVLAKIADGIANFFNQDERAVLYYYCDDVLEIPSGNSRHAGIWPQEYLSQLFGRMFQRHISLHPPKEEIVDVEIQIMQGNRPIIMHLIARAKHMTYVERIKDYVVKNYGK